MTYCFVPDTQVDRLGRLVFERAVDRGGTFHRVSDFGTWFVFTAQSAVEDFRQSLDLADRNKIRASMGLPPKARL